MTLSGIDISAFNPVSDWLALSSQDFLIMRATDGTYITANGLNASVDTAFSDNYANAVKTGIPLLGFYWVLENQPVAAQIGLFMATVQGKAGIPAIDVEPGILTTMGIDNVVSAITQFYTACQKNRGTGGLVYCTESDYTTLNPYLPGVAWWIANPNVTTPPTGAICWQSGTSTTPGFSGQVDQDQWLGTAEEFQALMSPPANPSWDYPIAGYAWTKDGNGYWIVSSDGMVWNYGTAQDLGSCYTLGLTGLSGTKPLDAPIVGCSAIETVQGQGLYLAGADGGVFNFGAAPLLGNIYTLGLTGLSGAHPLNAPIIGIAADPKGAGYTLFAQDGGIFPFGSVFVSQHPEWNKSKQG